MENAAPSPVPTLNKVLYSLGNVGSSIVDRVMATWVMYYYLPSGSATGLVKLVPETTFGLIFFIGRALDTIIDPGVAFYSDRCGSRRGRRMPFLLYGGLPLALSMALLFFPPVRGVSVYNSLYLGVILTTFFFFFSFYVCPYLGLLPELARTPEERINLTSLQGLFMLVGTAAGMVAAPMLIDVLGYRGMALIMCAVAAVAFYIPVAAINEKKFCASEPSSLDLVKTIKSTLSNRPFVIYLFGNLTFWFGFNIISTCVPYYVTVLLRQPEKSVMIFFALALGVTLFPGIPVVNMLTKTIGKRNTMILSLLMFMVLLPAIYFFGDPRIPMKPLHFGWLIIALIGIPLASLFVVPNAIVADLTDYDEKLTGLRREAIYFGAQGMFLKIDLGFSQLLMTFMFDRFGYSVANPLGVRLTGLVGGFFALVGIVAFLMFPRDLNEAAEKELARRGKK